MGDRGVKGWDIHLKTLICDGSCMRRALTALATANIRLRVKHVPAHIGIYGNEMTDGLAKENVK